MRSLLADTSSEGSLAGDKMIKTKSGYILPRSNLIMHQIKTEKVAFCAYFEKRLLFESCSDSLCNLSFNGYVLTMLTDDLKKKSDELPFKH